MTTIIPQCVHCSRLRNDGTCEAFQGPIPEAIAFNQHDHSTAYPGDRGMLFVPIEEVQKRRPDTIMKRLGTLIEKYNPDQPRDENGRWTDSGGSGIDMASLAALGNRKHQSAFWAMSPAQRHKKLMALLPKHVLMSPDKAIDQLPEREYNENSDYRMAVREHTASFEYDDDEKVFRKLFRKVPALKKTEIVYRGVMPGSRLSRALSAKGEYVVRSPASVSTSQAIARRFGEGGGVTVTIEARPGTRLLGIQHRSSDMRRSEHELLMEPGTRLRLVPSKSRFKTGRDNLGDREVGGAMYVIALPPKRLVKKYNPDQPRVPSGSEDGGQWAASSGSSQHFTTFAESRNKTELMFSDYDDSWGRKPGTYTVFRTGVLNTRRGLISTSADYAGSQSYQNPDSPDPVVAYEIEVKKPLIAATQYAAYTKLARRYYAEPYDGPPEPLVPKNQNMRYKLDDVLRRGASRVFDWEMSHGDAVHFDHFVESELDQLMQDFGYDALVLTKPLAPATREMMIPSSRQGEMRPVESFSLNDKKAYQAVQARIRATRDRLAEEQYQRRLQEVGKYDPRQPRVERGSPEGGRWVAGEGGPGGWSEEKMPAYKAAGEAWVKELHKKHRKGDSYDKWPQGGNYRDGYFHFAERVLRGSGDYDVEMALLGYVREAAGDDVAALSVLGSQENWAHNPQSPYEQAGAVAMGATADKKTSTELPVLSPAEKRAFAARTAFHQQIFRREYPAGKVMYRGVSGILARKIKLEVDRQKLDQRADGGPNHGNWAQMSASPASSWTESRYTAEKFASGSTAAGMMGRQGRKKGVVMQMVVRAEDVFMMPRRAGATSPIRYVEDRDEVVVLNRGGSLISRIERYVGKVLSFNDALERLHAS